MPSQNGVHFFEQKTIIRKPCEQAFSFFSNVRNLNAITPPDVHFHIISSLPVKMKKGALIDYRIKLGIFPFDWKAEITEWQPPFLFKDVQLKGPYKVWEHTHLFIDKGHYTEMIDEVFYLSPGGILEPFIDRFFVRKRIEEIFLFRKHELDKLFQ